MRKNPCPIGIDCDTPCQNYRSCKDLTISWEIPYTRTREKLIVKQYGWRRDWRDQSESFGQPIGWCPINPESRECGYYKFVYDSFDYGHNDEMNERLREAWEEAGWKAAEPIDNKPKPKPAELIDNKPELKPASNEPDVDQIPF